MATSVLNLNIGNFHRYPYSPILDGRVTTLGIKRGNNNVLFQPDYSLIDDGQTPTEGGGMDWLSGAKVYTLNGTKCIKLTITAGFDGWGQFGGSYTLPTIMTNSDVIWIRMSVYIPNGFIYDADPVLKFMRLHNKNADGTHQGYTDMYIKPSTSNNPPYQIMRETQDILNPIGNIMDVIVFDQWVTYDFGIRLSSISKSNGGGDCVHVWRNGEFIGESSTMSTQTTVNDTSNFIYLFTYWNGGCPIKLNNRVGNFIIGETVTAQTSGITTPSLFAVDNINNIIFARSSVNSLFTLGEQLVGNTSGATGNISFVEQSLYIKDLRIASYAPEGIL